MIGITTLVHPCVAISPWQTVRHVGRGQGLSVKCQGLDPEFLKESDTQTHVCTKFSTTCAKFLLNVKLYKIHLLT